MTISLTDARTHVGAAIGRGDSGATALVEMGGKIIRWPGKVRAVLAGVEGEADSGYIVSRDAAALAWCHAADRHLEGA